MKKIEVLQALEIFKDRMKEHILYTPDEPYMYIDTPSYMYKYFDKNDNSIACFSYIDYLHEEYDSENYIVNLYFGDSCATLLDFKILKLIIENL